MGVDSHTGNEPFLAVKEFVGILHMVEIVFFKHQYAEVSLFVKYRKALLFMLLQQAVRIIKRDPERSENDMLLGRHEIGNRSVEVIFEFPEILIGENTEKITVSLTVMGEMEGITIMMIEHRLRELFRLVNRVIVLNFGEKLAEGIPEEVMKKQEVRRAYLGREVGNAPG